ncbi:PREDICTED: uncharacterized protein LOC107069883 [Polistes dominula]|uniref:Uncharacterized protein LOC107069883 n=1 Tax=Polistes dominula TaxID=743375 RepID=A0ABM1IS65_POLDO|nr:PREDICTED: uncharacterized protein LOC107069883 [Polistes dominula]
MDETTENCTKQMQAGVGTSQEGPTPVHTDESESGSDPLELITTRAQDLTVENLISSVKEEYSPKARSTDSTPKAFHKPNRSGAAKRRARNARLALQGSDSEPHRVDEGRGEAIGQGPTKRPSPSDSTPLERHTMAKKNKFATRPTGYADAAAGDKKLAIVPVDYPEVVLGQGQDELLERGLLKALDSIPMDQVVPHFEGTRCGQGILWVTCSDDQAKAWLKAIVPSLKPWKGAQLQVLEGEQLPRLKKMTAVFPSTDESMPIVLRRLQRQNPELSVSLWRVWGRRSVQGNIHAVLGVDVASLGRLKELGFAPHFGLGRARFYEALDRAEMGGRGAGQLLLR